MYRPYPVGMKTVFLSARQATAMLGVKPETLYTYVSRGLLRSIPGDSPRERLYSREDVESLVARSRARAGHGPTAASALRWGDPVLESAITLITPETIFYRGVELERLPRYFENVAELLWSGILSDKPERWESE